MSDNQLRNYINSWSSPCPRRKHYI